MGSLSVFVDSSQDTLRGTAVLLMSSLKQELLGSPQAATNQKASEFAMFGMTNNLCCDRSVGDSFMI